MKLAAMQVGVLPKLALVGLLFVCVDAKFRFNSQSEVIRSEDGRVRGTRNRDGKDFVLGGLFPIHNPAVGGGRCGVVRKETGLERMEAMLFAVDLINADNSLLPGFTLGYDIRDTCSSENIGLDESKELVIANSKLVESCPMNSIGSNSTEEEFREAPTSGVVGASNSGVSVPVAGLLRLFATPQISYASSSALLNNRDRYSYFYRTTPPDTLQAKAMIDLLLHFNWTYISTIYSEDTYGEPGIDELHALAEEKGICIDLNEGIDSAFTDEQFTELAHKVEDSEAGIIILFTSEHDALKLFQRLQPIYSRNFTWIASDFWARSLLILDTFSSILTGMIGFVPQTQFTQTFHDYFSNLTLDSNLRNPWFEEWYSNILSCSIDGSTGTPCSRTQSVPQVLDSYVQGQKAPLVVDAVYAFAHALNDFLNENCDLPIQWFSANKTCVNQRKELNGITLLEYVKKVNFTSPTGNNITFDSMGNSPGSYDIINYQLSNDRQTFSLQTMGDWSNFRSGDSLQLFPLAFQFGLGSVSKEIILIAPESQCSKCPSGQFRRGVQSSCCGICDPCLGQYYSDGLSALLNCSICDAEYWGDNPLVGSGGCVPIPESFLSFTHPYSILIMIIAFSGLLCAGASLVIFIAKWTDPIIKSSGREQMLTLLVGITLSFVSAFFYVSPPHWVICGFQRWLLWTSFTTMSGALLVKVIRVARIFLGSSTLKKPRFTEPQYQVMFTLSIISVQLLILVISTVVHVPQVVRDVRIDANMPNAFPTLVLTCLNEHIGIVVVSLAYQSLLIFLCTVLGTLSFKYPGNFNEAKYIALSSMSILVIWIAFIITFFATQSTQELQNIAVSLAVVMTGYAVLLSIFGPKIYLIFAKKRQKANSINKTKSAVLSLHLKESLINMGATGESCDPCDHVQYYF